MATTFGTLEQAGVLRSRVPGMDWPPYKKLGVTVGLSLALWAVIGLVVWSVAS